jgi:predicted phosphodiesterase
MKRIIMSNERPKLARKVKFAQIIGWSTILLEIIAGVLLSLAYKTDVEPYLAYYFLVLAITIGIIVFHTIRLKKNSSLKKIIKIPIKLWFIVAFLGSIIGFSFAISKISVQYFTTNPYLTWKDGQDPSSAIVISWVTTFSEKNTLKYGISPINLDKEISEITATRFHHISISNLSANTTYYYKIPSCSIKQFKTAPVGNFNFTFYVWSDHRTNTDVSSSIGKSHQPNIVEYMAEDARKSNNDNAFSIFCGDLTSQSNDEVGWNTWFNDISYQDWGSNNSLTVAFGNHERYGDATYTAVQNYFPYPKQADGHFFYSFDYGIAHMIILDPYTTGHSWSSNFTETQKIWLENDLATHLNAKYTMIFMHPPAWALPGVKAEFSKLSSQYSINLVVSGHQHIYDARTYNGTKFITIGLGGNPNNEYNAFECDSAYLKVDVTQKNIQVQAKFINGTVLDSFQL